jgi:hypothetical protein
MGMLTLTTSCTLRTTLKDDSTQYSFKLHSSLENLPWNVIKCDKVHWQIILRASRIDTTYNQRYTQSLRSLIVPLQPHFHPRVPNLTYIHQNLDMAA